MDSMNSIKLRKKNKMVKKYTTVSTYWDTRRKLEAMKWDVHAKTFDDLLIILMEMKKVRFHLEKGGSKKEVIGPLLYKKLLEGWNIEGHKIVE